MAFDRTALVESVAGRLHLHGYHSSDVAMLYGVARFENMEYRKTLTVKNVPAESPAWCKTFCFAGAPRLAFERGISRSQARASLARNQHDGLIEVISRGGLAPPLRRINVAAMKILERAGSSRFLFDEVKRNKNFDLGPLDWIAPAVTDSQYCWRHYLRVEDLEATDHLTLDDLALVHQRPKKLYFVSTLGRDCCYMATELDHPGEYTFERGSDKMGSAKSAPVVPYLIIRHPAGTGEVQVSGQSNALTSSMGDAEGEFGASFEIEEDLQHALD